MLEGLGLLFTPPYKYLLILGTMIFFAGLFGRVLALATNIISLPANRKTSSFSHAATASFVILFAYIISIAEFGTDFHTSFLTAALPFLQIGNIADGVTIALGWNNGFAGFMQEVVQVFFMGFALSLVNYPFDKTSNLLSSTGPFAKIIGFITLFILWYFVQCLIVFFIIIINWVIDWMVSEVINAAFAVALPSILYVVLGVFLFLYLLKLLSNVFGFGAGFFGKKFFNVIFSFFKVNFLGKQLKTTFLTTLAVVAVVIAAKLLDIGVITTAAVAVTAFVPVVIILMCIAYLTWYLSF